MKALFVGLGSIGQRHLRNLLTMLPDTEILALRTTRTVPLLSNNNQVHTDISVKEKYNISEFEHLSDALNQKPNIVFVTNPTSMHIKIAQKAIESGAFVFIEKPLSDQWDGVEELLKAENDCGKKKIIIGYQYRFHPALKIIKNSIEDGRIGAIVGARLVNGEYMPGWHPYEDYKKSYAARKDLGGGAIVTQIHDFDYAMWLFGEPTKLFAVGGKISSLDINVEDSVQILMQCSNGEKYFPVSISMDYLQWPAVRSLSITGDKGSIECDLTNSKLTICDRVVDNIETQTFENFDRNEMFISEMKNILAFADGKEKPFLDLETGIKSLKIALDTQMLIGNI
jgi:predicted dehydrogenase